MVSRKNSDVASSCLLCFFRSNDTGSKCDEAKFFLVNFYKSFAARNFCFYSFSKKFFRALNFLRDEAKYKYIFSMLKIFLLVLTHSTSKNLFLSEFL